ncbi:hypothetical protein PVK06_004818 [Gossypium arboreum]|uniref:Uncharacterized protein n=1 Tax=Gossypium arboreum TaxID=29729 RepID=A0ABR0QTG2_GOSAR|nr:hypothetical protein PVK06_004818 [Gossypium arboreum]
MTNNTGGTVPYIQQLTHATPTRHQMDALRQLSTSCPPGCPRLSALNYPLAVRSLVNYENIPFHQNGPNLARPHTLDDGNSSITTCLTITRQEKDESGVKVDSKGSVQERKLRKGSRGVAVLVSIPLPLAKELIVVSEGAVILIAQGWAKEIAARLPTRCVHALHTYNEMTKAEMTKSRKLGYGSHTSAQTLVERKPIGCLRPMGYSMDLG